MLFACYTWAQPRVMIDSVGQLWNRRLYDYNDSQRKILKFKWMDEPI